MAATGTQTRIRYRIIALIFIIAVINYAAGGVFNMLGNIAGIVTPIVIGYIVAATGSFDGALVFGGAHCLLTIFAFLVIVGPIHRLELA